MVKKISELFGNGISISVPVCDIISANDVDSVMTYDGNGNLYTITNERGSKTFSYDIDGNLISIIGTGCYKSKTFTYDGNGNLIGVDVV